MSNRLTFSLASLTLIFALVFSAMPVLAHEDTANPTHQHPVITIAEPADADERVDGIQAIDSDAVTANEQVVYTVIFPDTPVTEDVPVADDFEATLRTADFLAAPTGMSATVGTIARDNDKTYTVPVTVTFLAVSDPATDLNEIVLNFSYKADAFTSQKVDHPTTDQKNEKTDAMAVTVLRNPPDITAPVLTPTVGDADATTGAITVTLAFDETFTTAPTVTDMTAATSEIANTYEVGDVAGSGTSFTVTVTPAAATVESGDIPSGTVTLTVSGTDDDGNAIAAGTTVEVTLAARTFTDTVAPEVVILPNPDRQSEAFDISFTATDNYSALTVAVAITPATAVTEAAPTAMAQAGGLYTVTVTPVAATEATPTISEQTITVMVTVTDEAGNEAEGSEFFFLAERTYTAPPDTTAPTLMATVGPADATTGAITVTLAFDEALQGMPTVAHAVTPATLAGTYEVSAVADDGDATTMNTYTVTVAPSALVVGDSDLDAGTVTLTVSAMDAAGNALAADNDTVEVDLAARIAPADTVAPSFTDNAPEEPISGMTVVTLTFSEAVSGVGVTGAPSMDDAKYTADVAGSGTAYTVTITPISREDLAADMAQRFITFTVSGADAAGNAVDGSFSLSLAARKVAPPPVTNAPPDFGDATIDNIVATSGVAIPGRFLPEADDSDAVTYSLAPAPPAGLSFNATTRALTGTPTVAMMAETAYTYTATDTAGGTDTIGFFITVNAAPVTPQPPANMPPAFADDAAIDSITATVGVAISGRFLPEATDPDGDSVFYWISPPLPRGLTFNRTTRALTGTPNAAMAQTAHTYNAVDERNLASPAQLPFFITVNDVAPVYADSTPVAITGTVGVAIETVDVSATDANAGDTLTYSWDVDEAALGLALDASTGTISGTPLKVHTGTHPVTATDSGGLTASRDVNVTISAPAPDPKAPVVTITTTAPTEPQTDSFAIAYTATDANAGDTVTVKVTHTVSPAGTMGYTVTPDAAAGMATIMQAAGSPIAVVTVTVTATDPGGLSGSGSIEVTFAAKAAIPEVVVPGAVTNLTATPGDGQVMLSWTAPADGGAVVSYEYSMNAGVSWTDIADSTAATTSYTVMGLTNGQTYSFIVRADNTAGPGGASNEISATPKQAPPAAPAAPANFTATAGQEKATLQWTVVEGATYQYRKKSGTATFKDDGTDYMDIAAADLKPVTGSTTMKMFEVTGLTGGTAYTFEVRVKASGSVSAGAPSSDTATPTSAPTLVSTDGKLTGFSVSAESYVLLVRSKATVQGIPVSVTDAQIIEWAGMPNLQALFYSGGSLQLSRNKTPKLDHDAKADTDARDAAVRDLILTEVMWARNTALIGKAGELDHQWIEIYNPLKVAVGGVTVETKAGRPPLSTTGDVVQLDMLSNQVGAGWPFEGLGQDGSDDMNNLTNDTKVNFVSMYRNNRAGDKHGWVKGHWSSSTEVAVTGHIGTPGRGETKTAVVVTATPVPRSPFVINEFGIGTSDGEDWVELRNVTESAQNLKNLLLTSVTGLDTEAVEFHFHDKGLEVPAKGVVLIASTDPLNSDIAAGVNLEIAADNQAKRGATSLYVVRDFDLPTGKFNLILRKDYNNKPGDFLGKKLDKVIDAIGSLKVDKDTANFNTDFWPLNGTGGPHGDVIEGLGQDFKAGTVYIRKNAGGGTGEHHLGKIGYIGVGYDRTASATDENGGTPGYDNGASQDKIAGLTTGDITISEIMIDTGPARQSLPQWIEFHNSSMTQAVNLNGWKLHIENAANGTGELETNTFSATLTLGNVTISPNQTVLIVTNTGRVSDPDHFPSTRVINLWTTKAHLDALEMTRRTDPVLSATGFNVTLADKDNVEVDSAGNLDGNRRTRDDIAWALPVGEDDGRRSSLIRVYDAGVAIDGTMAEAWVLADQTNLAFAISQTYYGDSGDYGTPGFRAGGPLPVSLSKFRPERLDDGSIRIVWITESELNNAGFNILRSETKDGEFKQINTKLIAGKGTTSERSTYTYTDPSAKPNVVYYYQIQDVSMDGKVTTLRETRLKGHISAAGKLTTTWGELKALQ